MKVTVCRKTHFNATHRLHNPNWSNDKNEKVFGKCNNPNYHGHNYNLIVKVRGEIDPYTGFVIDMKELKGIVNKYIVEIFDHKNLYLDLDLFKNVNPTAENIAVEIWKILRNVIDSKLGISIVLYETENNFVEFDGDNN